MPNVGIRELSRNPSRVVEEVSETGRPALVTKHGKPVVAIIPIDEGALEDWILANAPEFVEARREERTCTAGRSDERLAGQVVHRRDLDDVVAPAVSP